MKPTDEIQKKHGNINLKSALKTPNIYNFKNDDVDAMLQPGKEHFRQKYQKPDYYYFGEDAPKFSTDLEDSIEARERFDIQ